MRFFVLVITTLTLGSVELQACSCARLGPACQAAWASDAVFLGKVKSVTGFFGLLFSRSSVPEKKVVFEVSETFNGVPLKKVEVTTGIGGGDCGFPFTEGHDYLVYASRYDGALYSGICSRTAPVERATSDLSYLRSLKTGGPPSRIYGFVTGDGRTVGQDMRYGTKAPHPLAKVTIRMESATTHHRTVTDSEGNYAFEDLPPASLSVFADLPRNLGGGEKRAVNLRDHACSEQNFIAIERGQVVGRLVDDTSLPVKTTRVAMIPADGKSRAEVVSAYTNPQGVFVIQRVPPGDFVLGVNIDEPPTESKYLHSPYPPTYYPGVTDRAAAKVIHVGSAQQLTGFNLKLPSRLKQRMFWGSVVLASGKPAFGAYVELKDSEFPDWNADLGYADRNGSFLVYGVEGREYRLVGSTGIGKGEAPMHSEVVRIKTGASAPIRLMLSFPGKP